jgi:hypothetical protein
MAYPRRHPSGLAQPVSFRLSPAALARLDAWRVAAGRHLSRGAAVEHIILSSLTGSSPAEATAKGRHPATPREATPERRVPHLVPVNGHGEVAATELECLHGDYDVIAGGMRRCKRCGSIRGIGGAWRRS